MAEAAVAGDPDENATTDAAKHATLQAPEKDAM